MVWIRIKEYFKSKTTICMGKGDGEGPRWVIDLTLLIAIGFIVILLLKIVGIDIVS